MLSVVQPVMSFTPREGPPPMTEAASGPPASQRSLESREEWARFLSGLVHELKTPLASIGMIAELLGKDEGLGPKGKRYSGNLRELTLDLQGLVHDAGTLARLLEATRPVRHEPAAVAEVVARAAEAARSHGWDRGVSLATTVAPGVPAEVATDADLVHTALAGLLETAIALADKEVTLRVTVAGEQLVFAVEPDKGCGPEGGADALFEPFASGTSRRLRQMGVRTLGPLVSRESARRLGGDVRMVPGERRTSCLLRIPLVPPVG